MLKKEYNYEDSSNENKKSKKYYKKQKTKNKTLLESLWESHIGEVQDHEVSKFLYITKILEYNEEKIRKLIYIISECYDGLKSQISELENIPSISQLSDSKTIKRIIDDQELIEEKQKIILELEKEKEEKPPQEIEVKIFDNQDEENEIKEIIGCLNVDI